MDKLFLLPLLFLLFSCGTSTVEEASVREAHRPYFHFTPAEKWMNDPNGLVFYEGEYHLFYQYYPDSTIWGPMHWGHAVSSDLVRWEHLPVALYPDSLGYIFSGSAVMDLQNTSGLSTTGQPPMVAMYTYHDPEGERAGREDFQYQGLAYSLDNGRSWTKYSGNPVIKNPGIRDFRDPKVFWDEEHQQWICVLVAGDHAQFFGSSDLLNWELLSTFGQDMGSHGGVWECPDLFPLAVPGTDTLKWVLLISINPGGPNGGSATQYFIGDWDGRQFTPDPDMAAFLTNTDSTETENALWLEYGRDNYAGVTWSGLPDDQRTFIGWMSNWNYAQLVPTESWRSAMTLPRTLRLAPSPEGLRLAQRPVPQLSDLRVDSFRINQQETAEAKERSMPLFSGAGTEFLLRIPARSDFRFSLQNSLGEYYEFRYDKEENTFYSDRSRSGKTDFSPRFTDHPARAPRQLTTDHIQLRIFIDCSSIEIFADDGLTVLSEIFFPTEEFSEAIIQSEHVWQVMGMGWRIE